MKPVAKLLLQPQAAEVTNMSADSSNEHSKT